MTPTGKLSPFSKKMASAKKSNAFCNCRGGMNRRGCTAPVIRVNAIAPWHDGISRVSAARWSLLRRALTHHEKGAFEASVPIVLAQVDGIVSDLTGNQVAFFDRGRSGEHHLTEGTALIGIPEVLRSLRKLFSANARSSGRDGSLSRHGILHGRELGYDTLANSTKVFVLLVAVLDWALPLCQRMYEEQRQADERRYAGSDELDASGRRKDRRGLAESQALARAHSGCSADRY